MPDKKEKHIIKEGSRKHVLHYDNKGVHCSEHNCEINKKENFCFAPMQKNYMMEAEKLLSKKKELIITSLTNPRTYKSYELGYNKARGEAIPIVAKLLEEIEEEKDE